MRLLDGKKLSERILEKAKRDIKKYHLKLRLAIIQVGENSVSRVFIGQKEKACEKIGIDFKLYKFSKTISQKKLQREVIKIVKSSRNSGIVIQLPLPKNIKSEEILNLIPLQKDIDILSAVSLGKFYQGKLVILPPVVEAVSHFLKYYKIKIKGKNVVLVGSGRLVGQPLALWVLRENKALSVVNKFTKDINFFLKKADVLISGVGKPKLVRGKMVKKGVVAIDCGTSSHRGKLAGDVDFQTVSKKASYITPVPGGIGPLTVACLIENLIKLNNQSKS